MSDSMIGRSVGRYRIVEVIGTGGMAVVYKARDTVLGRLVALKILRRELATDSTFVRRFMREASVAAQLNHPHIATVYEVTQVDGYPVIAMEFVPGVSLAEVIRTEGALDAGRVSRIVEQVASALDYAHSRGLIHRDVKPGNVIVAPGDQTKLTDFGVAQALGEYDASSRSIVVGTLAYMSPEQVKGEQTGPASDVYSLGIVAYQALTGHSPEAGS